MFRSCWARLVMLFLIWLGLKGCWLLVGGLGCGVPMPRRWRRSAVVVSDGRDGLFGVVGGGSGVGARGWAGLCVPVGVVGWW